jgi:RIO-like serine/threonine protein kinase
MHRTMRKCIEIKIGQEYLTYHAPNGYTTHSDCRAPKYETNASVLADVLEKICAFAKSDMVHTDLKYR